MSACPHPVLVVEDHPDVRVTLQVALEFEGYESVSAPNVRTALRLLERMRRPGLVLLDALLPEAGHKDVIQYIRQRTELASVPIVLLTADEGHLVLDVQGMLKKPFTLRKLLTVVETHCQH
jgi:DNA-binding response OmpR family regulator